MNIDHIAIWTNNLETVKEFYLKYFDCTANSKYENTKKQFTSYFISFSGGGRIELMKRADIQTPGNNNTFGLTHIALNIGSREKVDSLTKILENDGFTIESNPRITGDGYYESVILDPENNRIELVSN